MSAGIVLLLAALVTFGIRSSLVHVLHDRAVGTRTARALTAAVTAGLAASVATACVARLGEHGIAHAAAIAATLMVARRSESLLVPLAVGMAVSIAAKAAGV